MLLKELFAIKESDSYASIKKEASKYLNKFALVKLRDASESSSSDDYAGDISNTTFFHSKSREDHSEFDGPEELIGKITKITKDGVHMEFLMPPMCVFHGDDDLINAKAKSGTVAFTVIRSIQPYHETKDQIIKDLLTRFKRYEDDALNYRADIGGETEPAGGKVGMRQRDFQHFIDQLRKNGYDYPEFKVIEKSMKNKR